MSKLTTDKDIYRYLARCEKIAVDADHGILPTQRRLNNAINDTKEAYRTGMIHEVLYDMISKKLTEIYMRMPK